MNRRFHYSKERRSETRLYKIVTGVRKIKNIIIYKEYGKTKEFYLALFRLKSKTGIIHRVLRVNPTRGVFYVDDYGGRRFETIVFFFSFISLMSQLFLILYFTIYSCVFIVYPKQYKAQTCNRGQRKKTILRGMGVEKYS